MEHNENYRNVISEFKLNLNYEKNKKKATSVNVYLNFLLQRNDRKMKRYLRISSFYLFFYIIISFEYVIKEIMIII